MNKGFCVFLFFIVACVPIVEKSADVSVNVSVPETVPEPPAKEPVVEKEGVEKTEVSEKVEVSVPEVVELPLVESGECDTFGCFPGDKIVADMQMDLFYDCSCARARWIKPEFILCFASEEEAVERGYRKAGSC